MAVTRIKNNQITDASAGNTQLGVNAAVKLQNYSVTAGKLANSLVYGSDLTISGNLTVNGQTTTVDTINTLIKDPILTLADGQVSGTPTVDIGLLGLRGNQNSSFIGWQESGTTFMAILSNTLASNTTVNVTSYANFTASTITAQANLSVIGNIVGAANFTGNVTAGNVLTPGIMSSTGNATHGNVLTGGLISATSTITGSSLLGSVVSASGNVTGGNVLTIGIMSSTGNATHGNVLTGGVVSAVGNITANTGSFFIGNGSQLTGVTASTSGFPVTAGTSNIAAASNGNIGITVAGTSNVLTITSTGTITSGTSSVSGNITVGNVLTGGLVSATANITGGNIVTGGLVSATANVTGGNINAGSGVVSTTGNVIAGNVTTGGLVSATANITGGNVLTGGLISATANVTGGNINTTGIVSTSGNVTTPVVKSTAAMTISTGSGDLTLSPTGNVTMSSKNINSLADPVQDQDAATKIYVDTVAQGLDPKASVLAGTANTLAVYSGGTVSYNNGTAGVGANLVTTGTYLLIDGANVQTANTRVLVKNEANATWNGIYVWSNATVLTRAADFNQPAEVVSAFTFVEAGTTNADTGWVCTTNAPVTFGTTNITWTQFSGAGSYSANTSAGISLTGTVFSALVDNNTTAFDGGGNISVKAGANLTTPNIGNATGQSLQLNTAGGNGLLLSTTVSATGNITGGNVLTGGLVSATSTITSAANITGGNILTGGLISATSNITGGNVLTIGIMSSTGNATHGNILTGGLISATSTITSAANITGGNILTGGLVSATSTITSSANITGANILTGGLVSATANITGGNVLTGGLISATANVTAGNVITGGFVSAAGNIVTGTNGRIGVGTATPDTDVSILANPQTVSYPVTGNSTTLGSDLHISGADGVQTRIVQDAFGSGTYVAFTGRAAQGTAASPTQTLSADTLAQFTARGFSNGTLQFGNTSTGRMDIVAAENFTDTSRATNVVMYTTASGAITPTAIATFGSANGLSVAGNVTGGNIVLTGNNINQLQTNSIINVNGALSNTNFAVNGATANVFFVNASANTASFGSNAQTVNAIVAFNSTNSILLPVGITGQRPGTGVTGMLRFNTTSNSLEVYNNSTWLAVGATTFTVIADEQFNGDGVTVAFTLSSTQTTNSCIVSINGVVQIPGSAYSVAGTNPTCILTFTEAPASGDLIDVREITTTTTVTAISNNSGNAQITGDNTTAAMTVQGNLNPTANVTYSLGNATSYWSSLYVGGNTIYLGGLQLKSATGNVFNIFASDGTTPATLGNLSVGTGNINVGNINNSGSTGTGNIGNATVGFNTIFAKATSAQYADLAEKYVADAEYAPGTVVSFGGNKEVTRSELDADRAVAGVVSTNPSYIMNATLEAEHVAVVAFTGRVPTSVTGAVSKGDLMVSNGDGTARAEADPKAGAIIGKALENFAGATGTIEVVIGRF
jgi:hypothetical protein